MASVLPPIGLPLWMGQVDVDRSYRTLRSHGTADRVVMATQQGSGRIGHRDGMLTVGPGDVVVIDPGIRHDYGTHADGPRWRFIGLHVQTPSAWNAWWRWPMIRPGISLVHLEAGPFASLEASLTAALGHLQRARHLRTELAMNAVEAALLIATESLLHASLGLDARLMRVTARVQRDLTHAWSVSEMAGIAGLSSSRFAHLFRSGCGETPRQFIERCRLEEAANRLRGTSLPVGQIAADLGFTDRVQFTRRFRRWYGQPPGRWRGGS